jgi:hypothetical protein
MQFLAGQDSTSVTNFRGPKQLLQIPNLGAEDAIRAFNCRYLPNAVGSRKGFDRFGSTTYTGGTDRIIGDFFNWIGARFNRIVMLVGSVALRIRDLATGTEYSVATLASSKGMSADLYGGAAYIASYNYETQGNQFFPVGADSRIIAQDPLAPATLIADAMWPGPSTPGAPTSGSFSGWAQTAIGTGVVTAGTHFFAAVFTTRTGYVFQPLILNQTISAAGALNYTITFNLAAGLASTFSKLQFAMTPAGEGVGGRYFIIPSATNSFLVTPFGITGGVLQVGVSDADLISAGQNILEFQQNFFQGQVIQGTAITLNPYCVRTWRDRMVYVCRVPSSTLPGSSLTESAAFISDAGLPQTLSFSRSIWQLPGSRFISAWTSMRDYSYVFGPNYTYIANYGTGDPATWENPQLVDAEIGAPGENCVASNPSKGYVWVANSQGLFLLVGATYQRQPISWYCTDWQLIDWTYVRDFHLCDVQSEQEIRFYCRLNTSGGIWRFLVFSYQNGVSPEAVQYSEHEPPHGVTVNIQSMCRMANVHDPNLNRTRLVRTTVSNSFAFPTGGFDVIKTDTDTTLGQDEIATGPTTGLSIPIVSSYTHAPLPADNWSPLKFNGVSLGISTPNGGVVSPSVQSKDGLRTRNLASISGLPLAPQNSVVRLFSMQSEGLRVTLGGVGQWILHQLEVFWGGGFSFRR